MLQITHDPRDGLTPSQIKWNGEHKARQARIAARALTVPAPAPKDKTFRPDPLFTTAPHPVEPPPPAFKEPWFSIICEMDDSGRRLRVDEIIRIVAQHYNV